MQIDRRTLLAGSAGLPLLPLAIGAARPLERQIFVFDTCEGMSEIVAGYLSARFLAPVLNAHALGSAAHDFLTRNRQTFGLAYVRDCPRSHKDSDPLNVWPHVPYASYEPAEFSTPYRSALLAYAFTPRMITDLSAGLTGWVPDLENRQRQIWSA
ncbi:MAG: hypothetical protein CVT79_14175 [Alphaproteobacteria bacterium HGW-Alphaproteobacteria-18]|nr:MAG: hypothetical protein CVT79_14175 [Alphaproteobacteria bacterium HGW-Alphaproteobacteria-18]